MFRGAAGGPHRPSRIGRGDERRKHVRITEEDAEHARTVRCSLGATADTVCCGLSYFGYRSPARNQILIGYPIHLRRED